MADCEDKQPPRKWKRKWAKARNKARNKRYEKDADYKEEAKTKAREYYRNRKGITDKMLKGCLDNLAIIQEIGIPRDLVLDGRVIRKVSFSYKELAVVLGGYNTPVIKQWVAAGRIPAPIYEFVTPLSIYYTHGYIIEEVMAMMPILSRHQDKYAYLTNKHTEVIAEIKKAVESARAKEIKGG